MTDKRSTKTKHKKQNPWFVDNEIKNRVMALLNEYRSYELKSQQPYPNIDIEDYINQSSPANMSNCGGQSNLISRPIENVVIKYDAAKESLIREIEEAERIVNAIDNGIHEATKYMNRLKKQKLLEVTLRRVLIDGKTYLSAKAVIEASSSQPDSAGKPDNSMTISDTTLASYKEKAIFFIAYFLGYISEKELRERNLPKREGELPQADGIYGSSEEKEKLWEAESVPKETKEQWRKKKALKSKNSKLDSKRRKGD